MGQIQHYTQPLHFLDMRLTASRAPLPIGGRIAMPSRLVHTQPVYPQLAGNGKREHVGGEAGIELERQALVDALERAGDNRTLAARLLGKLKRRTKLACLQMLTDPCLERRFGERVVWEPARGLWSGIKKSVNIGGRGFDLCRAASVAATATARTLNFDMSF